MIAAGAAEAGEQPILCQPFFGDDADRAVVQAHGLLALLDRPQQVRQRDLGIAKLGAAVELEPVDAGADLDAHWPAVR